MPQIRCPTCGTLINLESRRDDDFKMILKALENNGRTFSELFKITGLPRKTLSLRLKQLISCKRIVKNGRYYSHNGKEKLANSLLDRELHFPSNKKLLTLLIIIILGIPSASLALALMSQPEPKPTFTGRFKAEIKVYNVNDLYTWQVSIKYNQSELKVLEIIPGDFLGEEQVIANSTDSFPNMLMLLGSLKGSISGKNGDGTLAVIIFGYYTNDYAKPEIIDEGLCKTRLVDSDGDEIPFALSDVINDYTHLRLIVENMG